MTQEATNAQGDLYLVFPDEATALAVLEDYPGAVDVIGTIHKPTGRTLPATPLPGGVQAPPMPEMQALPGWHVNTRGPITPALQAYAVQPSQPARVWA